jgi:hypothetical protein
MAPFNKFNFRPVSLSIYQLGNVGAAQRSSPAGLQYK